MKVKDITDKLNKLDPDMDVILSTEDENLLKEGTLFTLFEIQSIDVAEAEKIRTESHQPYLKYGKSEYSKKLIVIDITTDF